MDVNFNNLRVQASYAYNRLINKLDDAMDNDYNEGYIVISPDEIEKDINDLRQMLVGICCTFDPDDDGFADVSEEVVKNGGWATFNNHDD